MREDDGRKLDHTTLEQIRIRAVRQIQAGAHPEDVAAALGMNRSTVFGWLAKYREGGERALKAKPVPGRPPKLNASAMSRIYALIVGHDPRQLQFEFALWTRELVAEMIARDFGVNLSLVSVGRLMKKMGLSVQRPLWRAWQQDPEAVQKWKTEEFPAIRAEVLRVASDVDVGVTADVDHRRQKGPTATAVGPLLDVVTVTFDVVTHPALVALSRR